MTYSNSVAPMHEEPGDTVDVSSETNAAQIPWLAAQPGGDPFDPYCDHVLIRHRTTGDVVAACRLLHHEQARRAGGFYAANQFDLRRLAALGPKVAEIDRVHVHPSYGSAQLLAAVWSAVCDYVCAHGNAYLMGCVTISIADYGSRAVTLCRQLMQSRLVCDTLRVFPYRPFLLHSDTSLADGGLPPAIEAWTSRGALICGAPAWEARACSASLLLLLPLADCNRTNAGLHTATAGRIVVRERECHAER